ncbi:hypothetical protein SANT12839_101060 [Streptomyces antimycoticus]|uniref:Uncharacterized protein n=1 Tax=Streptomyces antimycoticus TaxID=68175 RepID=A0A4D4KM14_9ACTN|nr:hypothetical protein [Streptomyces antimycoticus]GDY49224.1 hypothetical protein SANT12839_101060 [Streptomyces antimycoticus]
MRDHHPNAARPGLDPNLAELHQAGLRPGASRFRFARAVVYPLTWRGIRSTAAGIAANLRRSGSWHRAAAVCVVLGAAYLIGGWPALVCGVLVPRLLLYPQLAWLSLINEHTWFAPEPRTGSPAWVEAGRCLRLYPTTGSWPPSPRLPGSPTATSTTTPTLLTLRCGGTTSPPSNANSTSRTSPQTAS